MKGQVYTPHPEDDSLGTAIGYSLAFHAAVLAIFVLRVVFFPTNPVMLENAIRVDMVSLPDKSVQALPAEPGSAPKKMTKKAEPAPEPVKALPKMTEPPKSAPKPIELPKPNTKVSLDKAKHQEDSALKRLEAMERLEKMNTPQKPAAAAPSISKAETPGTTIKGNAISKGAALTGIAKLDNDNYVSTVTEKVKQNWNLPRWLATSNLRAVVKVFIDAQGNILKKQMVSSSNNETFDDRVMAAIESAAPFPAPPDDLAGRLSVYGFELDLSP